ncbi:MAG TPA: copper chaperone PCu(A)C [Paracoccus sp. (in: a-proteobacteria)]|nr:copper chaperone PCu(A)C [Paracoccus sp. (in: a-proteobacteria)]
MKTTLLLAAAALLPLAGHAQTPAAAPAADIAVTGAYARSSNPQTGAAFMIIANGGSRDCALTGAATDMADTAELHTSKEEGGVMRMLPVESIPLAAGATHELARGGDHIMMMGLKQPLKDGDHVALTLDFGDCGSVALDVTVDNRAGMGKPMGGMDHGQMHGHGTAPAN